MNTQSWIVIEENKPHTRGLRLNVCKKCDTTFESIADEWYDTCINCTLEEVRLEELEKANGK